MKVINFRNIYAEFWCMDLNALIKKYNVPAPRYTSYPTVPYWSKSGIEHSQWMKAVNRVFEESNKEKGISLYLHLPFCESLCTYCACNTRITRNHAVEENYIRALLAEWKIYREQFSQRPVIRELHLGGGTPTFFSPQNLKMLISELLVDGEVHPEHDFSFEGHPNNTTHEHLEALFEVGFRRVSYGVQDLDEKVMRTINRVQPYENVRRATENARKIGYTSVNFDLIYGLPYQTLETIEHTFTRILKLRPQRIAFYSYAHVPWVRPGQRSYTSADLPDNEIKRALYEKGKELLKASGYHDLGMDHFALREDELFSAYEKGKMHRNFMGYTTSNTDLLLGLGSSSISDAKYAYGQNLKTVEDYSHEVLGGHLAIFKGHEMSREDLIIRENILSLTCRGSLHFTDLDAQQMSPSQWGELEVMVKEGLLERKTDRFRITPRGMAFLRNICMLFDRKLRDDRSQKEEVFSKSI